MKYLIRKNMRFGTTRITCQDEDTTNKSCKYCGTNLIVEREKLKQMELKSGTEILIKARIVRLAKDNKPKEERGYLVETSRKSKAYVDPQDIYVILLDKEGRG